MTETTQRSRKKGHIGLVVLASIASGLALGLLLVLAVFAGGAEAEITGAALLALGAGFVVLAIASSRFTAEPQPWALAPGLGSAVVGLAVLALSPGDRVLAAAGWVWPALLLVSSAGRSAARAGRFRTGPVARSSIPHSSSSRSSRAEVLSRPSRRRPRATPPRVAAATA
jgi:hypothetical protein